MCGRGRLLVNQLISFTRGSSETRLAIRRLFSDWRLSGYQFFDLLSVLVRSVIRERMERSMPSARRITTEQIVAVTFSH